MSLDEQQFRLLPKLGIMLLIDPYQEEDVTIFFPTKFKELGEGLSESNMFNGNYSFMK